MLARDVMTANVVAVAPETDVREIAKLLLENRISAVPVIDGEGRLVGIVSEGDLMRRPETGTMHPTPWWLWLLVLPEDQARKYVKTHGHHAREVMTSRLITIGENAPLEEIADVLNLSPSRTRHLFKEVLGEGVREYLQQLRVNEAKRLLNTTDVSIIEVCMQSGFQSATAFYRAFNQIVGMTPQEYRENSFPLKEAKPPITTF